MASVGRHPGKRRMAAPPLVLCPQVPASWLARPRRLRRPTGPFRTTARDTFLKSLFPVCSRGPFRSVLSAARK